TYTFQFIVVDNENKCRFYKADTVDVEIKVLPPLNQPPTLTIANANPSATSLSFSNTIDMIIGPPIQLLLTGTDSDVAPAKDNLTIELIRKEGTVVPDGFTFETVKGTSPIQAT